MLYKFKIKDGGKMKMEVRTEPHGKRGREREHEKVFFYMSSNRYKGSTSIYSIQKWPLTEINLRVHSCALVKTFVMSTSYRYMRVRTKSITGCFLLYPTGFFMVILNRSSIVTELYKKWD